MKKILLVILLASFLLSSVGVVSVSKGKPTILRSGKVIKIKTGTQVKKLDIIKTNRVSIVQIIFKDRTTITVGKNSKLSIKDYFFDVKKPSKAKAKFGFAKGFFKTITGKIGKINPDKFKIKVKTSTIGIRGTQFTTLSTNKKVEISVSSGEVYYKTGDIITDIKVGEIMTYNIKTKKIEVQEKEVVNTQIKKEKKKATKKTSKQTTKKSKASPSSTSGTTTGTGTTSTTTNIVVANVEQTNNLLTEVVQEVETTQTVTEVEPVVEEPKAIEPVVEEPKVIEPVVEEPVVEEPKVEEPKVEEPKQSSTSGTIIGSGSSDNTPTPTPTPVTLSEANMLSYIEQAFNSDSVTAETFLEGSKISASDYQTMRTGSVTAGYATTVKAKLDGSAMEGGVANFEVKFADSTFTGDIKIGTTIDVKFNGGIANGDLSSTSIENAGTTASMKVSTSLECSTISGSLYGENAGLLGGIINFDDVADATTDKAYTIKGVFYGGKN